MYTIVIEILRNGQTASQLLQEDMNYIALCSSLPAKDFKIDCSQQDFDENAKSLRYGNDDENARAQAINFFQDIISKIITQIYPTELITNPGNEMLHLRLVTTPKEIAQLPFELALLPDVLQSTTEQTPFFANKKVKTTITREVRRLSFEHYEWPIKPRILFAWAQPNENVPWQQHFDAFIKVLTPWAMTMTGSAEPIPDLQSIITELKNATLSSIKDAICKAIDDEKPYTHIHLLAHGSKKEMEENEEQFLLVLNNDDQNKRALHANGEALTQSLIIEKNGKKFIPQIVSLVACDSGNVNSPLKPIGSLAHMLYEAGIPCVFASQFPLTQDGSVKLVTTLYEELLLSSDPRKALYNTRMGLMQKDNHDWASLVSYARFPEDIEEQMKDVVLKNILQQMKAAHSLADHLILHIQKLTTDKINAHFNKLSYRLNYSIDRLTELVENNKQGILNKERFAEHHGLIGSAYKRKAEQIFRLADFQNSLTPEICEQSIAALKNAKKWYYEGYKYLNSHWAGTQYLTLCIYINEQENNEALKDIWELCRILAQNDEASAGDDNEKKAWAYGTLAELNFLRLFIYQDSDNYYFEKSKKYIELLNNLPNQDFPKQATARQLERYIYWWPKVFNGAIAEKLKNIVTKIREQLSCVNCILPESEKSISSLTVNNNPV